MTKGSNKKSKARDRGHAWGSVVDLRGHESTDLGTVPAGEAHGEYLHGCGCRKPPQYKGDEMMGDEDNSSHGSRWHRIRNRILGAYRDNVRAKCQEEPADPQEEGVVSYEDVVNSATYNDSNTTGGIWQGNLTVPEVTQPKSWIEMSDPMQAIPLMPSNWNIQYPPPEPLPYTRRCNYCGLETVDYRELRIGRMTKVVVCDICMLKTINSILGEPSDRASEDDTGSKGDH